MLVQFELITAFEFQILILPKVLQKESITFLTEASLLESLVAIVILFEIHCVMCFFFDFDQPSSILLT